jgi:DNA-binding transcriptional ArsR family regulator
MHRGPLADLLRLQLIAAFVGIQLAFVAVVYMMNIDSQKLSRMTQRSVFRQQAQVLKLLANESRLVIIDRLNRGECSVGELTGLIGSDVSTVSKHLALLRANGIVEDRRQGTTVFYRPLTPSVCKFFVCATQVLQEKSK